MRQPTIVAIIPAYNESETVGGVIAAIKKENVVRHIVVVDDGSSDGTSKAANVFGAKVIRHPKNRGLGATLETGFQAARLFDPDAVVTIDADGQHDAQEMKKLVQPILDGRADVVIGSRTKSGEGMPILRRIAVFFGNVFTWMLFGMWSSDTQSGYRAFSKRALDVMRLRSQRMEVSSEIFQKIARYKLRFEEVPVRSIYTEYSLAKGQKLSNGVHVMWKLLLRAVE
ncbi:MAG: glycosyltransferase family 2 protein [bacterium]|nr:glycosyltransferase family 2 protein [bacterium]